MDLVLIAIMLGFVFGGWRAGFLHTLLGLLLTAIAFVLGAYIREPLGALIAGFFPDIPADYTKLLAYSLIFPIVLGVLHFATLPITKRIHPQGLTQQVDRSLGALFGLIEGVLVLSAAVVIFDAYFAGGEAAGSRPGLEQIQALVAQFNATTTVHLLRETTVPLVLTILGPLLPKDISSLVPGGVPGLPGLPGFPH